jgi:hypothetical protein
MTPQHNDEILSFPFISGIKLNKWPNRSNDVLHIRFYLIQAEVSVLCPAGMWLVDFFVGI